MNYSAKVPKNATVSFSLRKEASFTEKGENTLKQYKFNDRACHVSNQFSCLF